MKRVVSIILILGLLCGMGPAVLASNQEAIDAADALYALGLFKGTGTNADGSPTYELDRAPTRHEAVTMLVRLLGKEEEAITGTWETPFTDVADWAKPYVGYAYANGLTNGTGKTTFDGELLISVSQYLTFVLRALGYESGKDFEWNKAWELSDSIGVTNGEYNENTDTFLRSDLAIISYSALSSTIHGTYTSLLDYITGNPVRYTFDGELGMSKKIKLVKVNGNYYYIDQYLEADNAVQFGGRSIEYTLYTKNEETAVFCSGIKKLAPGSYYYWWYPLYYAILIAEGSYKTTSCNNPNVNGAIVLSPIELAYKDLLSTGSDEPQYISASVTITPVWMEYNNKKLYAPAGGNHPRAFIDEQIRYINDEVCLEDLLNYYGLNCNISFGDYQGLTYMEIK